MSFRPWGRLDWITSLAPAKRWYFLGALGTTDRSLCSWGLFKQSSLLQGEHFAQIFDVDSDKYHEVVQDLMRERVAELARKGGSRVQLTKMHVMDELFRILQFAESAVSKPSVVLDVTEFPKRYFFPILRALVRSSKVKDLLVTYTAAMSYAEDQPLYEDVEPWRALPGFSTAVTRSENWIVSVGFLVESLRQYLGDNPEHEPMKLLLPYPGPLGVIRRTWESVVKLEGGQLATNDSRVHFQKFRVDAHDISATFDRIASLARSSTKATAFAPFGPKPTSVAMCLYAIAKNCAVYYAQPTVYHPNYAVGIYDDNPLTAVNAYWIKRDGENLYSVSG